MSNLLRGGFAFNRVRQLSRTLPVAEDLKELPKLQIRRVPYFRKGLGFKNKMVH